MASSRVTFSESNCGRRISASRAARARRPTISGRSRLRRALGHLVELVPQDALLQADPEIKLLVDQADEKVYNIVQLIYRAKKYEASSKDYEFSRLTMEEHWASGYNDALQTLRHPEVLQRPGTPDGVAIFDFD